MKICFLTGIYPFSLGGAEYQSKILAENFSMLHKVFFITNIANDKRKIINANDTDIHNIKWSSVRERLTLYYFFALKIKSILKKESPDIIYHRVLMPYTWIIAKYAKRNKIPFILHIASEHSITFGPSVGSRIRKLQLLKILKTDVHLLVQTPEQKLLLSQYTDKEIVVLSNLLYGSEFPTHDKAEKNIVWIGKSASIKQLNIFLDVAEKMKNFDINFVVISRFFEDELSQKLLERISSLPNVINIGEKHNDYINQYLSEKACLLVNTSVSEGFSNTFLQAWMRGVPVISLNSNPGNIFDENEMGLYCNSDVNKIEEGILKFISDSDYYDKVSKSCYDTAHTNFSVEKLFVQYKDYLENKI